MRFLRAAFLAAGLLALALPAAAAPGTDSSVTLPDDSANTGKKLDEWCYVNAGSGATVCQQRTQDTENTVLANAAALTTGQTFLLRGVGERELSAILNIKTTPTGTSPTLTMKMQDVDPIDETTTIGQAISTAALTTTGATVITHRPKSPTVLLTITLGGTSPVFSSNNLSVSSKQGDDVQPVSCNKSNVSGSASSVSLLSANSARKKFSVVNNSSVNLYVDRSGGTSSNSSFTDLLLPNAEIIVDLKVESGAITGIWDSATGNAQVTECN